MHRKLYYLQDNSIVHDFKIALRKVNKRILFKIGAHLTMRGRGGARSARNTGGRRARRLPRQEGGVAVGGGAVAALVARRHAQREARQRQRRPAHHLHVARVGLPGQQH